MDFITLALQLISGVVGGNFAGFSKQNLGPVLNSIFGAVGGVVVGQLLAVFVGDSTAITNGPLDVSAILANVLGGGAGGALLSFLACTLSAKFAAK
ncbi:hypothetical protein [Pseudomonas sp. R5(2019)]|uniref:hypothetical protein n=1 Tax=Pseudomonas sp. R5(2019) TaxID=2697566 RepID=UPI00141233D7|nr:hypothetical protein [Pseudomonas sp. R5(2019)]NBA97432.1 hypothetical protein [Pseudomonas sp. R5(2019)]